MLKHINVSVPQCNAVFFKTSLSLYRTVREHPVCSFLSLQFSSRQVIIYSARHHLSLTLTRPRLMFYNEWSRLVSPVTSSDSSVALLTNIVITSQNFYCCWVLHLIKLPSPGQKQKCIFFHWKLTAISTLLDKWFSKHIDVKSQKKHIGRTGSVRINPKICCSYFVQCS